MTTENKIIKFVKKHRLKHGYAPTYADIARELDTTRQNITYHFHKFSKLKALLDTYPEYRKYKQKEN